MKVSKDDQEGWLTVCFKYLLFGFNFLFWVRKHPFVMGTLLKMNSPALSGVLRPGWLHTITTFEFEPN